MLVTFATETTLKFRIEEHFVSNITEFHIIMTQGYVNLLVKVTA